MRLLALLLALTIVLIFSGCDGKGLNINIETASGDDQAGEGEGEGEGEPVEPEDTDLGTWVASYSDDFVSSNARFGRIEYSARMHVTRNGSVAKADGVVYRVLSEGGTDSDRLTVKLTGNIDGSDMVLTATSASGGVVSDVPTWRLRFADNRMVGAYVSSDVTTRVVRSGHAMWYKTSSATVSGTWVTAFADDGGTTALPARSRTGVMTLEQTGDAVDGTGDFVEQRQNDVDFTPAFDVTDAEIDQPEFLFTLSGLDLDDNDMNWFSMTSSGTIVGAFGQFTSSGTLARIGHATWIYSPVTTSPSSYTSRWTAAFSDTAADADIGLTDYIMSINLTAGQNNAVTGSGVYFTTSQPTEGDYQAVRITNAVAVGNHLQLEIFLVDDADTMTWDLRLGSQAMMGSYIREDGLGRFVSRGFAQWRRESTTPALEGTWVSAWYDTPDDTQQTTQFTLVTISSQESDGTNDGFGALRYADGSTDRRLFDVFGDIADDRDILWTWSGSGLFGNTLWRLRQSGNNLFGVYQNLDSTGAIEATGSAWWIRTSTSDTL
jgi:hypothetical protein